ncbi:GntR family transcriptional regulator [Paracoccus fontiphilus]|uniref:GntR family transcriptional regulator n=1 Tax=Paracoccus fontiphilus TaxID=1815556 RepID=A0ABV7I7Y0_9RHOB|nr:FCD domain-containing protein [Paracoccus fontiphilus]
MKAFDAMRLADRIGDAILKGDVPPGTRLDAAGVASLLGLSEAAARDVLAEICARGLAQRRSATLVEVMSPDPAILLNRFEALGEIQALCAGLAARRAPAGDLLALEDLVARLEEADSEAYAQMSLDLHERICRMTRNPELARVARELRQQLSADWRTRLGHASRRQRSIEEHRALVEAIQDRNEGLAATIMRGHLRADAREVLFMTRDRSG